MRITVLIENTAVENLAAEHGLSLFIQFRNKNYLLDAGQSSAFLDNAAKLSVPIEKTDYCILSHGHYDHSGGFAAFLKQYDTPEVYAMKQAKDDYYSGSGGTLHPIGLPASVYPEFCSRFHFINKLTQLDEHVYLLPHNTPGLDSIGKRANLYKKVDEQLLPDDFAHELSLVFDTSQGLVIFNSCSHGGIHTILNEAKTAFPSKEIYAFFGGLHMKGTQNGKEICTFSECEVKKMADCLLTWNISRIYTGHCTGTSGFQMLKQHLGDRLEHLTTGKTIEI